MNTKEENIKRSSFLLYIDKKEIVENLTDEQAGKVFKAIYKYVDEKEEIELDPVSKIVFVMFKQLLDKDENRYLSIVERNRINGSRGGRPKKEENPKNPVGSSGNPKKPKKANNNTNNNTNNNIEYYSNKKLNDLFLDFLKLRKELKARNTDRAINSLLNTLSEYDDATKYKMIDKSIRNSWKDVFPLKENKSYQQKPIREEIVPEWFNKKIEEPELTEEAKKEMDELLREFDNP